ncbi:MAG TPA: ribokinase [Actinomycetota bacterium]|nr:ribokinase [Actinomycetota bacterium]
MSTNIVVVGSANVDLIMRMTHLPAPGETVIGATSSRAPGGKGANQAAAAARLGARTWFVGAVGDDELGRWTREDLEASGVDCTLLATSDLPTGVAHIWLDEAGENSIAVASGANGGITADDVERALARIEEAEAVVLTNLEIPDEAVAAAARHSEGRGWRLVLNPAPAHPIAAEILARCAVVTPNETEAQVLAEEGDLLEAGVDAVVVTLGARGAELRRRGTEAVRQPPFPVEALDTTGAGDAFSATIAWALADGRALEDAVRLAAGAGALATRGVGARSSLADRAELEAFVSAG